MNDRGTIYIAKNKIDGKCYVGQTVRGFKKRISEHKRFMVKTSIFEKALKKYGMDRFTLITIDGVPVECLDSWEAFFIKALNALIPDGYNLTLGGPGIRGHHFTEESKERMRARKAGIPLREDHRENIRKALIGRVFSEEWRRKLSEKAFEREALKSKNGFIVSGETRKKLGEATKRSYAMGRKNKGHPFPERSKEHMRQMMTGRVFSEETKHKMSEAAQRRWRKA